MRSFKDIAYYRSMIYGTLSHFYIYIPDQKITSIDWKTSFYLLENPINETETIIKEIEDGAKILINFTSKNFTKESLLNLLKEWTRILRGIDIKGPLPPYESVYLTGRLQNKPAQEIYHLFLKMGVNIPEEWHQPPDYIGVELDFMRLLCERELEAWKIENLNLVKETFLTENSFIKNHIGSWVPDFCETMKKEARLKYFKGIARLTKGMIEYDKVLIPFILENLIT